MTFVNSAGFVKQHSHMLHLQQTEQEAQLPQR